MKCILSDSNDPYFNLAAEEYLLKHFSGACYFQYVNDPAVVVGKHQNALAEIDLDYLEEENIMLARRISGGGAVYHDHGNMNYAFITNETPGDFIKFRKYTAPVIAALEKQGISASLGKRNELLSGGKKISGTASHVYKSRVLHHGTLLYNSNLEHLSKCLYVDTGRYRDKAVKSVRSEVVNLKQLMEVPVQDEEVFREVFAHILYSGDANKVYAFTPADRKAIETLVEEKFSTWDWVYGYSPRYEVERTVSLSGEVLQTRIFVSKGVIEDVICSGTIRLDTRHLSGILKGIRHSRKEVLNKISGLDLKPEQVEALMKSLF